MIEPADTLRAQPTESRPRKSKHLAEMEHERWMKERTESGWRYGPKRNDTDHRHPDLHPWAELDPETRAKDADAVRAIPPMLAEIGFVLKKVDRAPAGEPTGGAQ